MKKINASIILACLLVLIFSPIPAFAQGPIVTCGNNPSSPCGFSDFFTMLGAIYTIIVKVIATPLATIGVVVGGILMMVSAGNPNMLGLGKKIFWSAIIGLVLVFCSYLIIKTILTAIGYSGTF